MIKEFKTTERIEKISRAVKRRQRDLTVVMENVHDPHNLSAAVRSCDAVGVENISLLYHIEEFPEISPITSRGANKWINEFQYENVEDCFSDLKKNGYTIYVSMLDEEAIPLYDIDFTEKVAIVMGNENRGISPKAAELADHKFFIPMMGMVQSLNISVATAVTLYEALRQRKNKGLYENNGMDEHEINRLIEDWCRR